MQPVGALRIWPFYQLPIQEGVNKVISELSGRIFRGETREIFDKEHAVCRNLRVRAELIHPAMSLSCMNRIKDTALYECSCDRFNRLKDPSARRDYENAVINKVIEKVNQQNPGNFQLSICFYSSGFLGSETILLTRLLKNLNERGYSGRLNISVIDTAYDQYVQNQGFNLQGDRNIALSLSFSDFSAFLAKNSGQVQCAVKVFSSDAQYAVSCQRDQTMRPDVFAGSDFGTHEIFTLAKEVYNIVKREEQGDEDLVRLHVDTQNKPYIYGDAINTRLSKLPKFDFTDFLEPLLWGIVAYCIYKAYKSRTRDY